MEKARVALIGAGWWGACAHIPALKQHPRAELVAVQSRSRDKAEKIAADFGVPHACVTPEETLAVEGLDAVIVSSTPNVHYEQARAALGHGLRMLVEKPMTSDPVEVFARFDNAGGALASLMSHRAPMPGHSQCEIHVHGAPGAIDLDSHAGHLSFHSLDGQHVTCPAVPASERHRLYASAHNLADCALGVADNQSPGELGWYAMRVIEASSQSARLRASVVLPAVGQ